MKFRVGRCLLISFLAGFIVSFITLFDNLIILINLNEYGMWGIGGFIVIFIIIMLIFSAIAFLLYLIIYLIVKSVKEKNNVK